MGKYDMKKIFFMITALVALTTLSSSSFAKNEGSSQEQLLAYAAAADGWEKYTTVNVYCKNDLSKYDGMMTIYRRNRCGAPEYAIWACGEPHIARVHANDGSKVIYVAYVACSQIGTRYFTL